MQWLLATGWIHSNVYYVYLRSITTHSVWLLHKYIAHIKGGINMFPWWIRIRTQPLLQRIVKNDVTDNKDGGRTCVTYFAEEGVFLTLRISRFVKEGYLFVPRYVIWGVKIPLQSTRYRRLWHRVTAEVTGIPSLLQLRLPLNRQRIIKYKVKIRVPVYPMSVSWIKEGAFFTRKSQRFFWK